MTTMDTYDHYDEAKRIAEQIERAGFKNQANQVRQAIAVGVSGTEIFMKIRFALEPLQNVSGIDLTTRIEIAKLIHKINEALER